LSRDDNPNYEAPLLRVNSKSGAYLFMTKVETTRYRVGSGRCLLLAAVGFVCLRMSTDPALAHPAAVAERQKGSQSGEKLTWKTVEFAIVRYNDDAPASWNMYHGEKKGLLLVRLWRRYLFLNIQDQEVYELDPQKVKVQGDNSVEWSPSDLPPDPIETSEWKVRDVGPMKRIVFRFGKNGNFLDIQLPLLINGKPMY
jgi:hypothetical protein